MQRDTTAVDQVEQALWRAGARSSAPAFATPVEAWQAGVMRAIRLAADRGGLDVDFSWLALQRAAALLVLTAALSWLLVWQITPATETLLAQEAWLSHSDVVNVDSWNGE
ncbi:MAG: hypothetical protein NTV49_10690 [Kiritimatiellaeota bacterium]|nr:hypothetical protein [Kiritimatiellota bacterium]